MEPSYLSGVDRGKEPIVKTGNKPVVESTYSVRKNALIEGERWDSAYGGRSLGYCKLTKVKVHRVLEWRTSKREPKSEKESECYWVVQATRMEYKGKGKELHRYILGSLSVVSSR